MAQTTAEIRKTEKKILFKNKKHASSVFTEHYNLMSEVYIQSYNLI